QRNGIIEAPFLIDFIDALQRRGHQVFAFTQDRPHSAAVMVPGVTIEWFPWRGSRRPLVHLEPWRPADCLRIVSLLRNGRRELPRFLKQHAIEACLALWIVPAGYFAYAACRATGIPYSVWALGSDVYRYATNPLLQPIMRRIIRGARGVFADGFDMARRI